VDQIRAAHPNLTDNGVRAAIAFEAEVLGVRRCLSCGRRPGVTILADETLTRKSSTGFAWMGTTFRS